MCPFPKYLEDRTPVERFIKRIEGRKEEILFPAEMVEEKQPNQRGGVTVPPLNYIYK